MENWASVKKSTEPIPNDSRERVMEAPLEKTPEKRPVEGFLYVLNYKKCQSLILGHP